MRAALAALFSLAALPAASEPVLTLPVDCILGETCHIQQYVDRDAGDGYRDYQCGNLAYDGHKGTDFSLPNLEAMKEGVNVIAAAPGVVRGVRDGVEDRFYTIDNADAVKGKECGNGLVVRHDNGWETQYCHLKKGSVRVRTGYKVKRGTVLGEIGLSGKTQFPHLHLSVRHKGKVVDPFSTGDVTACNEQAGTLWRAAPDYLPGGMIEAGFSDRVPEYDEIHAGTAKQTQMAPDAGAMVLYGFAYGGRKGDIIRIDIQGPQGFQASYDSVLEKNLARFFRAYGKRLKKTRWPSGNYDGIVTMIRDGEVISRTTAQASID